MEGGFSKALLLRKEDGMEMIAKIPCPNAGPPHLTTASEVAVLQFVKQHTEIPVPGVLAWNSDQSNEVGAEYIIMEKATGVQLFKVWSDMDESHRLALIEQLVKYESQLADIRFPARGHLYLRPSIANSSSCDLDSSFDRSSSFCIGPSCDRSWLLPARKENEDTPDSGPWVSLADFGIALARREIFRVLHTPEPVTSMIRHGTTDELVSLLQKAIEVMNLLETNDAFRKYGRPTLWHTDLHMGNIFVSEADHSQIVSIIDWQSISVSPLFLQARWPEFLRPPSNYPEGFVKPELPANFDELDSDEKEMARFELKKATHAKAYEVRTFLDNKDAHHARNIPEVFRALFIRCGQVWEEGSVPLRACLIEIFRRWSDLGLRGKCPYTFTTEEIEAHETQFREYREWHGVHEFAREYLDTDAEGWISPELDFEEQRQRNKALFELWHSQMASDKPRELALRMWPFPESL